MPDMTQSARIKIPVEGMSVIVHVYKDIDARTTVIKNTGEITRTLKEHHK